MGSSAGRDAAELTPAAFARSTREARVAHKQRGKKILHNADFLNVMTRT
jgi:hypothetical protein